MPTIQIPGSIEQIVQALGHHDVIVSLAVDRDAVALRYIGTEDSLRGRVSYVSAEALRALSHDPPGVVALVNRALEQLRGQTTYAHGLESINSRLRGVYMDTVASMRPSRLTEVIEAEAKRQMPPGPADTRRTSWERLIAPRTVRPVVDEVSILQDIEARGWPVALSQACSAMAESYDIDTAAPLPVGSPEERALQYAYAACNHLRKQQTVCNHLNDRSYEGTVRPTVKRAVEAVARLRHLHQWHASTVLDLRRALIVAAKELGVDASSISILPVETPGRTSWERLRRSSTRTASMETMTT